MMSHSRYTPEVALNHPRAIPIHRHFASLTLKEKWRSARSPAAVTIYAMKAQYQWSAPSCSWHAPLQLFFAKFWEVIKQSAVPWNSVQLPIPRCWYYIRHVEFYSSRNCSSHCNFKRWFLQWICQFVHDLFSDFGSLVELSLNIWT